jgi:predicted RND superfamily exporter protein
MKELKDKIVHVSVNHYKAVTLIMVLFALVCGAFIPLIKVDTDPENMLSADEPVRVFHNETKKQFDLSDIVVLGVINEDDEHGVFNPGTLGRIYELTEFARTLRWPDKDDPDKTAGVIEVDMIAPSLVDHIGQGGPGVITFEWLMPQPPKTQEEALAIRDKALNNPMLKGTMVSEDGKALMLFIPLTDKHLSYRVYTELNKKIAELDGDEEYHITGLPVAEDTFGVEMFIQMAISAPLAMLTIFILMIVFFRKLVLVISPMIIAMVSVISTMGLLIGFGYPVHIMSSMIPIFLMPIAVVDSVHILSEFFDVYTKEKGRRASISEVMHTLFTPMLYTSLTSAAGFLSLALTPIPPVQVFGIFVATGIMIAWVFTVTFVPAYVMMIPDKRLANFGMAVHHEDKPSGMTRLLHSAGRFTYARAKAILVVLVVLTAVAVWGITKIQINDNPVKWFSRSHPIRIADTALNDHFGGTYMAYLVLDAQQPDAKAESGDLAGEFVALLKAKAEQGKSEYPKLPAAVDELAATIQSQQVDALNPDAFYEKLTEMANQKLDAVPADDDDLYYAWNEIAAFIENASTQGGPSEPFKDPQTLRYIAGLQKHLETTGFVGKSNSVADVVKKVHQELTDGTQANYTIPENQPMVSECLIQFQQSHRPHDLWHMVTPDYRHTNVWMQLTSGDNKDMEQVVKAVDAYFRDNPPPQPMTHQWAGLTYINTVWQEKMVFGMLESFLGSFVVVFIMMSLLFRSPLWGLLCMVPLTITIAAIYGAIGFIGKDYDMPVAVLSALTLGMAVDFAIHFLERSRATYAQYGSWQKAAGDMFGEPARAISRNVLVIAIGFLPLLAAPLVPYKTVGIFLCAIMAVSGVITLLALPAVLSVAEKWFFKKS